jgi:hypothetical protein
MLIDKVNMPVIFGECLHFELPRAKKNPAVESKRKEQTQIMATYPKALKYVIHTTKSVVDCINVVLRFRKSCDCAPILKPNQLLTFLINNARSMR